MINRRYSPHSVDHFVTWDNRLLNIFVRWRRDASAVAVDTFMLPLKGENPKSVPPVACIPQMLQEVLCQQVTVTLVAP